MATMYETIMELPLFKGIGEDQLSILLEKTSIEFVKYEKGDVIYQADEKVKFINFILNGKVRQSFKLDNFALTVEEILGRGAMIGATHLFGMETYYTGKSVAIENVSLMKIAKNQYMDILQSDKIYLLNYVNYLSAEAQTIPSLITSGNGSSIRRMLEILIYSIVSRAAEEVMIYGDDNELARYCGVNNSKFEEWKAEEIAKKEIVSEEGFIRLKKPF